MKEEEHDENKSKKLKKKKKMCLQVKREAQSPRERLENTTYSSLTSV